MFLVIDGLQVPVALNQGTRGDALTAGQIATMFDGSLRSSARGVARRWEWPTHPLPLSTARALEGLAAGLRRVQVWGDAIDTDSTAPVEAFVRLERLGFGKYAGGERRRFAITVQEADPIRKALNWESGFPAVGSFSRASTAYYRDRYGVLQQAASGEARVGHYVTDAILGIDRSGWLLEPLSTNQIADPAAFNLWTQVALTGVTSDAATKRGVPFDLIIPDTANSTHFVRRATAGNATAGQPVIIHAVVAKGGGYNACALRFVSSGAFSAGQQARFDLAAETATVETGTPTAGIEHIAGDLYHVWMTAVAANTGAVTADLMVYSGSSGTFAGNGTSGLYAWCAIVEFNRSVATSPFTASSRALETLSRALPGEIDLPTDAWVRYTRWSPRMNNGAITGARIWQIGDGASAGLPRLELQWADADTIRLLHTNATGSEAAAIDTTALLRGTTGESLVRWNGDGTGDFGLAVGGSFIDSAALAGTLTPAGGWNGSATTYPNSRDGGAAAGAMTLLRDFFIPRRMAGDLEQLLAFCRRL